MGVGGVGGLAQTRRETCLVMPDCIYASDLYTPSQLLDNNCGSLIGACSDFIGELTGWKFVEVDDSGAYTPYRGTLYRVDWGYVEGNVSTWDSGWMTTVKLNLPNGPSQLPGRCPFFETRLVVECDEGIMTTILAQIRFQPEGSATKTYINLKIEGGGPSSYDTNQNIIFNRMNYDLISDPNDVDYDSDYPEFKEFILSGLDGTECLCQEGGDDPEDPICIDCRDVWQNASKNQPSCKLDVGAMGVDDMGGTCDICTTVNNEGLVPFMELGQNIWNADYFGKWQWQSGFVNYCATPPFNVAVSLKCVSGCSSTMQAPGFVCTNNSGCVQQDTKLWWTISVVLYGGDSGVWVGTVCSCDVSVVNGKLVSPPISITLLRNNTQETCVGVVRFAPALGENVFGVGGNNAVGGADDVCLTRIPVTKAIAYPGMPCPTDPRLPIPTATPSIDCRVLPNEWSHQVGYCGSFGLYGVHDAHFKECQERPTDGKALK